MTVILDSPSNARQQRSRAKRKEKITKPPKLFMCFLTRGCSMSTMLDIILDVVCSVVAALKRKVSLSRIASCSNKIIAETPAMPAGIINDWCQILHSHDVNCKFDAWCNNSLTRGRLEPDTPDRAGHVFHLDPGGVAGRTRLLVDSQQPSQRMGVGKCAGCNDAIN